MKPAESVCVSLEIHCSCLRQHCYPDTQVASKLYIKESVSKHTDSAVKLLPQHPCFHTALATFSQPLACVRSISVVSAQQLQSCTKQQYTEKQSRVWRLRGLEPGRMQTQHIAKHLNPPKDKWTSATHINGACMPCLTVRNFLYPRSRLQAPITQNCTGILHPPQTYISSDGFAPPCLQGCFMPWEQITGSSVMKVECFNDIF